MQALACAVGNAGEWRVFPSRQRGRDKPRACCGMRCRTVVAVTQSRRRACCARGAEGLRQSRSRACSPQRPSRTRHASRAHLVVASWRDTFLQLATGRQPVLSRHGSPIQLATCRQPAVRDFTPFITHGSTARLAGSVHQHLQRPHAADRRRAPAYPVRPLYGQRMSSGCPASTRRARTATRAAQDAPGQRHEQRGRRVVGVSRPALSPSRRHRRAATRRPWRHLRLGA